MADFIRVEGKTVEEALTEATVILGTTSEMIDYEVIEKGSSGFLGIGSKPAIIKARKKMTLVDKAIEFLENVFDKMGIAVDIQGFSFCRPNIELTRIGSCRQIGGIQIYDVICKRIISAQ